MCYFLTLSFVCLTAQLFCFICTTLHTRAGQNNDSFKCRATLRYLHHLSRERFFVFCFFSYILQKQNDLNSESLITFLSGVEEVHFLPRSEAQVLRFQVSKSCTSILPTSNLKRSFFQVGLKIEIISLLAVMKRLLLTTLLNHRGWRRKTGSDC